MLLSLKPDLVLAAGITNQAFIKRMRQLNLTVWLLDPQNLDETIDALRQLGRHLALEEKAETVAQQIQTTQKIIRTRVSQLTAPLPQVLFFLDPSLNYCAGDETHINTLIEAAGGHNAGNSINIPWPKLSQESIAKINPDILLICSSSTGPLHDQKLLENRRKNPIWRQLKAVKTSRVHAVDRELFTVPGIRMEHALVELFELLHTTRIPSKSSAKIAEGE